MREIFLQEAEKRGLAAIARVQDADGAGAPELLIAALFDDHHKKKPGHRRRGRRPSTTSSRAQTSGTEYRARHILVEKEDEAKALITQIKGGAKFEDIAKKNSKDPGSGANGGDLDFAAPGSYVPEFCAGDGQAEEGRDDRRRR